LYKYDDQQVIDAQPGIKHICCDGIKTAYKQKGCEPLLIVLKMKISDVICESQGADAYDGYYKGDDENNSQYFKQGFNSQGCMTEVANVMIKKTDSSA
jgi:L-ribulose-5-phosphate 3-epimerase UlaE